SGGGEFALCFDAERVFSAASMTPGPPFLVMRPEDLLLLAVRWDGLQVLAGPPARLAGPGPATIEVTFPPQSIAEVKYVIPGDVSRRPARAGGPSRLTFALGGPVDVELSAAGVLGLLAGAGVASAAIELPWHLVSDVAAAEAGVAVVATHATGPVVGRDVVGLWHTALSGRGAGPLDAALVLRPLEPDPDPTDAGGLDIGPLNASHRAFVRNFAPAFPPRVRRLQLSALGGSLMARQESPDFSWEHTASLGRDERVRIEVKGVLYPFGHRAELTALATRSFEPAGSPTVAGMQRQVVLTVPEPVRSMAGTGRRFPFSEVEILKPSWSDLAGDVYLSKLRPKLPPDDLVEERGRLTAALEGDGVSGPRPLMQAAFDAQRPASQATFVQTLREAGDGRVVELDGVQAALSDTPDGLRDERRRALERKHQIESIPHPGHPLPPPTLLGPTPPPPSTPPPDTGLDEATAQELMDLNTALSEFTSPPGRLSEAHIAQVERDRPGLTDREGQLKEALDVAFAHANTFELFVADLAAAGDATAVAYRDIIRQLDELQARQELIASQAQEVRFAWTPRTTDGRYLRFPLRLAGTLGDVAASMPLTFVPDLDLPPADHYAPYSTLDDPDVLAAVEAEWAAAVAAPPDAVVPPPTSPAPPEAPRVGTVDLPAVRIDLVRAPTPAPGDVHEVHALSLRGERAAESFLPVLQEMTVDLPAVRSLLPELAKPVVLVHTPAFLRDGPIPDVPLQLPGDDKLPLSFRPVADRSGGLVSPAFAVDAVSRTLGPVAAGALPPGAAGALDGELPPFDLESVYSEATLLGFPLTDLIRLGTDHLPVSDTAPVIKQLLADGIPAGVSMTWTLALDAAGPFLPRGDSRLVLAVEVTRAGRTTTCTVNDFSLVLPPGGDGDGLLTLDFAAVVFTQHDERAPHLDIKGLKVRFGGALKLLDGVREKLDDMLGLPGCGATVEPRPDGVTAGYGLSVPSVTAGGFLLRNIAMHAGVDVPFTGNPVSVSLSFATRENPFNVSILAFGGGGYIDLTLGPKGIQRLEASMEFGASLEVDFVVASGEVHALGGVRFTGSEGSIAIDGYVRIGGSVEVLGLVSVSIELVVNLHYERRDNHDVLVGSATLVVEIDVTLFSESVEIDSGEWILVGGGDAGHPAPVVHTEEQVRLEEWTRYRDAFERA
ncbi:MAG: hypothetical protein QOI80_3555, partial [Solirubrobacteraceae bacterium]|nr:hypothetical protein [Solirubrobacteraceae bacterium]